MDLGFFHRPQTGWQLWKNPIPFKNFTWWPVEAINWFFYPIVTRVSMTICVVSCQCIFGVFLIFFIFLHFFHFLCQLDHVNLWIVQKVWVKETTFEVIYFEEKKFDGSCSRNLSLNPVTRTRKYSMWKFFGGSTHEIVTHSRFRICVLKGCHGHFFPCFSCPKSGEGGKTRFASFFVCF